MGLSFRKSLNIGPFRFNLSTRGIGASVGVPGFRVGTGPRGQYVSVSSHGLTYRTTAGGRRRPGDHVTQDVDGELLELSSGSVENMTDTSAAEHVNVLNQASQRRRWPIVLLGVASITVAALAAASLSSAALVAAVDGSTIMAGGAGLTSLALATISAALAAAAAWAGYRYWVSVVVTFYELDDEARERFAALYEAVEDMNGTTVWHVAAARSLADRRRNAGASYEVARSRARIRFGNPPRVRCNTDLPSLSAGRETLYFAPDCVLVFDTKTSRFGAVRYEDLNPEVALRRFIEEDRVPADATVVGHTWAKVNKDGSPDRRFKGNRQLPICQYADFQLYSDSGLNEHFTSSSPPLAHAFVAALRAMGGRAAAAAEQAEDDARDEVLRRVVAVVTVLKAVALADRRVSAAEREALVSSLRRVFPNEPTVHNHADHLLTLAEVSPDRLAGAVVVIRDSALRDVVLKEAELLTLADGKATAAEKSRLAELRQTLGAP